VDSEFLMSAEIIFVFGTDESGRHENALAQLAVSRWGACRRQGKGLVGSSYAIPVRSRDNERFSKERLVAEVEEFKAFVLASPDKRFVLSRIGCDDIGFSDAKMAPLFSDCGPNVAEPGKWLRRRDPSHRVIAVVGSAQCDHEPSIKWAIEMTAGFSGAPKGFVVSDDDGADSIARKLIAETGVPVAVEVIDRTQYGGRAAAIANRMMAISATHVLLMDSGGDAKCAHMRKTAASEGIDVYDMKIGIGIGTGRDPEVAKRSLEEVRRLAAEGAASTARRSGPSIS
jgi:hypothetical protein